MDIKYIKDKYHNDFYPVAHEKGVIDDNGTTLESKLEDLCKTVDIEDIDNLNTSSLREDKLSTFFTVVATTNNHTYNVGTMQMFSDNLGHVLTQVLFTHYVLDEYKQIDTSTHYDDRVYQYFRNCKINGGTLPTDQYVWTPWVEMSTRYEDEEDITAVTKDGIKELKLSNKPYAPVAFSGLGRKYLRKNIVDVSGTNKNILTSAMISDANTIYYIQYDYTIPSGTTITLPSNSRLVFDGGSISGEGTLALNNTYLEGDVNITTSLTGNVRNPIIYAKWFGVKGDGVTDDTAALQRAVSIIRDNELSFEGLKNYIIVSSSISLNIGSSQLHKRIIGHQGVYGIKISDNYDVSSGAVFNITESEFQLKNLVFYASASNKTATAISLSNRAQNIVIDNCSFQNMDVAILYSSSACYNSIKNCNIYSCNYGFKIPDRHSSTSWCGAVMLHDTKISSCQYGVWLCGYYGSVLMEGGYLEGCKNKIYVADNDEGGVGSAYFRDVYFGDESENCILINGGNTFITASTSGNLIGGAYTVTYADSDKTKRLYTIRLNKGNLYLDNITILNAVNGEKANGSAIFVGNDASLFCNNVTYCNPIHKKSEGVGIVDLDTSAKIEYTKIIDSYTKDGILANGLAELKSSNSGTGILTSYTIGSSLSEQGSNKYGGNIVRVSKSAANYCGVYIPYKVPSKGRYSIRYKFEIPNGVSRGVVLQGNGITSSISDNKQGMYYLSSTAWYGVTPLVDSTLRGGGVVVEGSLPIEITTNTEGYIGLCSEMSATAESEFYFDLHYLCLVDGSHDAEICRFKNAYDDNLKPITNVAVASGTSTLSAEMNKCYVIAGSVGTLAITLPSITNAGNAGIISFYMTTASTTAVTFTSADSTTISYFDGYEIEASKSYEINAMYNGSKWVIGYAVIG